MPCLFFFFFNVLPSYGLPFSYLSLTNIYLSVSGLGCDTLGFRCVRRDGAFPGTDSAVGARGLGCSFPQYVGS